MWREWIAPVNFTPVSQFLTSFSLGILFSPWSISLVLLLVFTVVYELCYYAAICKHRGGEAWQGSVRLGVVVAYIAGWILGRSLHDLDISFLTPEEDEKRLGRHSLCRRRTTYHTGETPDRRE